MRLDIAAGRAKVSAEQLAELAGARELRLRVMEQLACHPWLAAAEDRFAAKQALREAATKAGWSGTG